MLTVPTEVGVAPRAYLTPSLFIQGRKCLARLAWASSDAARLVPQDPSAILGTALHRVQEQADRGELSGQGEAYKDAARTAFDRAAADALAQAHPLVRMRYPRLTDLPRFYLQRAQSAEMAFEHARSGAGRRGGDSQTAVEQSLASRDGLLRGRADCLDVVNQRITDYKSGSGPAAGGDTVSKDEELQLLFYAALARDNGVPVREGCIVRADGRRASCSLPADAAAEIADEARTLLASFSAGIAAGLSPDALAAPSPSACTFCSFRALCPSFWREAAPAWSAEVGSHAQMLVEDVREAGTPRAPSVVVRGQVTGGSVTPSAATAHFPLGLITTPDGPAATAGSQLRLLHVREETETGTRLLPDRERGFVWLLPPF